MALGEAKLLASEIIANWPEDQPLDTNSVLKQHPELQQHKSVVLDLAFEEYTQRLERGEQLAPETFANQFSTFQRSLAELLQVNQYLHVNQLVPTGDGMPLLADEEVMGFQLIEQLGEGAFSRVFLARQAELGDRDVVVKFYQGGNEAATLGPLEHPHIVPVHSVDHDDDQQLSALCMPYLGRATLLDVLDRIRMSPKVTEEAAVIRQAIDDAENRGSQTSLERQSQTDETKLQRTAKGNTAEGNKLRSRYYVDAVADIGRQLADALQFTHSRGMCHGDIKPSNVLVLNNGHCRLFDFNLSFANDGPLRNLGGTLPYMAPEQLRCLQDKRLVESESHSQPTRIRPDSRADLFAWGVTMYELLTGKHPFGVVDGDAPREAVAEELLRRQAEGPTPIRNQNAKVPASLATIIEDCLVYDLDDRTQTAQDLCLALKNYQRPWRRGLRWMGRHVVATTAVAILLLGLLAGIAWVNHKSPGEVDLLAAKAARNQGHPQRALTHLDNALAASDRIAEAHYLRGLTLLEGGGNIEEAIASFDRALELEPQGELAAWIAFQLASNRQNARSLPYHRMTLEKDVDSAAIRNNLGYSLLQSGHQDEAMSQLLQATLIDRSLKAAWRNLVKLEVRRCFPTKSIPNTKLLAGALQADAISADFFLDQAVFLSLMARNSVDTKQSSRYLEGALDAAELAVRQNMPPRRLRMMESVLKELGHHRRYQQLLDIETTDGGFYQPAPLRPPLTTQPFD